MLVLSRRLNEKLLLPDQHTSIQVIAIKSGVVRLGIDAPEEVRVLREEVPDRQANWGPAPHEGNPPISLLQLNQMLNKRLEIARLGLSEAQQLRSDQPNEANFILEKVDEDLHMLQHRLRREFEKIGPPERTEWEDHEGHLCQTMALLPR
jgi:carbon storage regulator CsrA